MDTRVAETRAKLCSAQADLQRLSTVLSQENRLTRTIGHDLRNVLTSVIAFRDLLLDEPHENSLLADAEEAVSRAERFVRQAA